MPLRDCWRVKVWFLPDVSSAPEWKARRQTFCRQFRKTMKIRKTKKGIRTKGHGVAFSRRSISSWIKGAQANILDLCDSRQLWKKGIIEEQNDETKNQDKKKNTTSYHGPRVPQGRPKSVQGIPPRGSKKQVGNKLHWGLNSPNTWKPIIWTIYLFRVIFSMFFRIIC